MQIHEIQHSKYVSLTPEGDLDANSSIQMDECIRKWMEAGIVNFHIECSQLAYISSAGLGVFISFMEELRNNNGQFVFSGMDEKIYRVFELLGLHLITKITQTTEEAESFLNQ